MSVLSYFDVVLIAVAAPIMILIGVPAAAYLIAAGAWVLLRLVGIAVERYAITTTDTNRQIGVRMGYMLGRLFSLALVVILVRKGSTQNAAVTALAVIVVAFTIHLVTSAFTRPARPARPSPRS
jgi:hypothetical protein